MNSCGVCICCNKIENCCNCDADVFSFRRALTAQKLFPASESTSTVELKELREKCEALEKKNELHKSEIAVLRTKYDLLKRQSCVILHEVNAEIDRMKEKFCFHELETCDHDFVKSADTTLIEGLDSCSTPKKTDATPTHVHDPTRNFNPVNTSNHSRCVCHGWDKSDTSIHVAQGNGTTTCFGCGASIYFRNTTL